MQAPHLDERAILSGSQKIFKTETRAVAGISLHLAQLRNVLCVVCVCVCVCVFVCMRTRACACPQLLITDPQWCGFRVWRLAVATFCLVFSGRCPPPGLGRAASGSAPVNLRSVWYISDTQHDSPVAAPPLQPCTPVDHSPLRCL